MGEIKSTLDLVLEKTKHLSQSAEEKEARIKKDIISRINGMLQKHADGLLSLAQLQRNYQALKAEYNLADNKILAGEVLSRLDPGSDNPGLFEVLEHVCHLDCSGIAGLVRDHQAAYHAAAQNRIAVLKEGLAHKYSISGSAVLPNLETDARWRRESKAMASVLVQKINREKERLIGS